MSAQQTLATDLSLAPPRKTKFIFDIDYKTMYHNVKRCNEIALRKLERVQRSEGVWKKEHAKLIDALWGWTTYSAKNQKPLTLRYPIKPTKEKTMKKKSGAASSFTFPPERETKTQSQVPSSPTHKQEKHLRTPVKNAKRKAEDAGSNKKESLRKRRSRKKLLV